MRNVWTWRQNQRLFRSPETKQTKSSVFFWACAYVRVCACACMPALNLCGQSYVHQAGPVVGTGHGRAPVWKEPVAETTVLHWHMPLPTACQHRAVVWTSLPVTRITERLCRAIGLTTLVKNTHNLIRDEKHYTILWYWTIMILPWQSSKSSSQLALSQRFLVRIGIKYASYVMHHVTSLLKLQMFGLFFFFLAINK